MPGQDWCQRMTLCSWHVVYLNLPYGLRHFHRPTKARALFSWNRTVPSSCFTVFSTEIGALKCEEQSNVK